MVGEMTLLSALKWLVIDEARLNRRRRWLRLRDLGGLGRMAFQCVEAPTWQIWCPGSAQDRNRGAWVRSLFTRNTSGTEMKMSDFV